MSNTCGVRTGFAIYTPDPPPPLLDPRLKKPTRIFFLLPIL